MRRVFADDWRDCLREQFKYVIQQGDRRTEETLTEVLHEVGFSDDELAALRLDATMRADDMPDDYVPEEVQGYYAGVDVPEADVAPEVIAESDEPEEIVEVATYDELVEMVDSPAPGEGIEEEADEPPPEDDEDDSPQQMSLF